MTENPSIIEHPGAYDRLLGEMLQRRDLSPCAFVVISRLFWTQRARTDDWSQVTIEQICRRTGRCRDTVNRAIQRAVGLGILRKIKTTVRRAIGSRVRAVNGINRYVFVIPEKPASELDLEVATVSESFPQGTSLKDRESNSKKKQYPAEGPEPGTLDAQIAAVLVRKSPLADALARLGRAMGLIT